MGCKSCRSLNGTKQVQVRKFGHDDGHVKLLTITRDLPSIKKYPKGINEQYDSLMKQASGKQAEQAIELYNSCMDYFGEHNIDNAYKLAQQLNARFSALLEQIDPQCQSRQRRNIERIIREYNDINHYNSQIQRGGWVLRSDKKGVQVSTRQENGTVELMMEGIVEMPYEAFLAVIVETDLFKNYVPYVTTSQEIAQLDRNCRLGYTVSKMPMLSPRQSYFQGLGFNRLEKHNCIFFCSRSITSRPGLVEEVRYTPKMDPNSVELLYEYFVVKYKPLSRTKGKVLMAVNGDNKTDYLPAFLVQKCSAMFGQQIFANIKKAGSSYKGSEWEQKVQSNSDFYTFIRTIVQQYLSKKENTTESSN